MGAFVTQVTYKKTGLARLVSATKYSAQGIQFAYRGEAAFRQELFLFGLLLPAAVWLAASGVELILLVGSMMLVLLVELLNTAIEAVVDRQGQEFDLLARAAKDLGSAAVLCSLVLCAFVWAVIIVGKLVY